jgi:hypothetical protein
MHIDNNTFVDAGRTSADYGAALSLNASGSVTSGTNCSLQNNIFYNCGRSYPGGDDHQGFPERVAGDQQSG